MKQDFNTFLVKFRKFCCEKRLERTLESGFCQRKFSSSFGARTRVYSALIRTDQPSSTVFLCVIAVL